MKRITISIADDDGPTLTRTAQMPPEEWALIVAFANLYRAERATVSDGTPVSDGWHVIDTIDGWVRAGCKHIAEQQAKAAAAAAVQTAMNEAAARTAPVDTGSKV